MPENYTTCNFIEVTVFFLRERERDFPPEHRRKLNGHKKIRRRRGHLLNRIVKVYRGRLLNV